MKNSKLTLAAILFVLPIFAPMRLLAQCLVNDRATIKLAEIKISPVTCPQNGSITLKGLSGGGGEYAFEIIDGPVKRGIQSQNSFAALSPGRYRIRITGCNGTFLDTAVIVGNFYLETAQQTHSYLSSESYKCNGVANGKVRVNIGYYLPTNEWSDTQYYSLPLRYQVSENGDPATGFSKILFRVFANGAGKTEQILQGGVKSSVTYDTIRGLKAGITYYIRVTDQCGAFKTTAIAIPTSTAPVYTYDFQLKEPFDLEGSGNQPAVKGNCVQWGQLTIMANGKPVRSIAASNTFAPIKAVLKRQDNGQIIDTRVFQQGNLTRLHFFGTKSVVNNNLLYDSIPRVPLKLELTDQCGKVTAIAVQLPSAKPAFKLSATTNCTGGAALIDVHAVNAAPSLPAILKVYNDKNELLINKQITSHQQYLYNGALSAGASTNDASILPGFGRYSIVMQDNCGVQDSIHYQFAASVVAEAPAVDFKVYEIGCPDLAGNKRFNLDAQQTGGAPVAAIKIVSGPAGLSYPRFKKSAAVLASVNTESYGYNYKYYFDSLLAGTYQVVMDYGCSEQKTVTVEVSKGIEGKTSGYLAFTTHFNPCGESGSTVVNTSNLTTPDINLLIADPAYVRIIDAPMEFLKAVTISKNGAEPKLPFVFGNISADNFTQNGIDTSTAQVYPRYSLMNLSGVFVYPPGTYTFQLYGKCSGNILDTKSFTIAPAAGYRKPVLGASSGYFCTDGTIKIIASPAGGSRPFLYQIKLASDPDITHYSPLQGDSVFVLPAGTKPGTVYSLRMVDACNNSYTGQVAINNFTGKLFIAGADGCTDAPVTIITGNIPGGVYTWTKPDGSQTLTNSGELYISRFSVADIGNYKVTVNAIDGCIVKSATGIIGNRCYEVLPIQAISLKATRIKEQTVELEWDGAGNNLVQQYIVEKSNDGENWSALEISISRLNAGSRERYTAQDVWQNEPAPVVHYRVKLVDAAGRMNYTQAARVVNDVKGASMQVYANPFLSSFNVDFISPSAGNAILVLFDLSGKEISRLAMPVNTGVNRYQFTPVGKLEPGNYVFSLMKDGVIYSSKITKGK